MKQRILNAIDREREHIIRCGEQIWKNPELGFKEYKTSALVQEEFEKLGIPYESGLALTGVRGTVGKPDAAYNICIIGEMDAVKCFEHPDAQPDTGAAHACGHNAQVAAMLGAAYGLVRSGVLEALDGKVTFFAVPAEEFVELDYREQLKAKGKITCLSGKQELIHSGAFEDVDMAMMIHSCAGTPRPEVFLEGSSLGFEAKTITFLGKAAHASTPCDGINALNAAMLALMGIHANRETFREEDRIRIHPIVTNGGDLVNVVPERAVIETYVRGANVAAIEDACRKVDNAVNAGALAVGASCEIHNIQGYKPLRQNQQLSTVLEANAKLFVEEDLLHRGIDMTGSTDMGDLSHIMPCVHPSMGGFEGTAHGADFRIADPEAAYILPAKIMACTVYDLLKDGATLAQKILNAKTE